MDAAAKRYRDDLRDALNGARMEVRNAIVASIVAGALALVAIGAPPSWFNGHGRAHE